MQASKDIVSRLLDCREYDRALLQDAANQVERLRNCLCGLATWLESEGVTTQEKALREYLDSSFDAVEVDGWLGEIYRAG